MDAQSLPVVPFGKYKGKQMVQVPASYLLFLYETNKCSPRVKEYIEDNFQVLKKESDEGFANNNLLWTY